MDARARDHLARLAEHERQAATNAEQARELLHSEALRQHEHGASVRTLAGALGVGASTVMDWIRASRQHAA